MFVAGGTPRAEGLRIAFEFSGLAFNGSQPKTCRVLAVHFTDGSVWPARRRQER